MARILIVDDDKTLCNMLVKHLSKHKHQAAASQKLQSGLLMAQDEQWDVVLLDVQMPDGNGLDFIPDFLNSSSKPEVIIITGQGASDGAEKAILSGAWSYIEKPHVIRDLPLHLKRVLQYQTEKSAQTKSTVALQRAEIAGDSPAMARCFDELAKAANSEINVMITGETGTGKELFARAIHENSARKNHPFIIVDCASLPANLLESVLFGHVKGAFTGAEKTQEGLIVNADGGTLFLDEVGELPLTMQKAFLRVLQEHSFRPIGSTREIKSDFRLLAATNRNLEEMIKRGLFRADLFFRLSGLTLELPSLSQRLDDIKALVQNCTDRLCERYNIPSKGIASDFIEALAMWKWPGNVRQLFQTIEHVFAGAINSPTLFAAHLPSEIRVNMAKASLDHKFNLQNEATTLPIISWQESKNSHEKKYLEELLLVSSQDIKKACSLSGISRARLYQLIKKHQI